MTYPEKIWQGSAFVEHLIFVLGESWYGDYSDELVTDDGYIRAYLAGRVADALYTRIANACQLSRQDFWDRVMFTNFVQRVGATRDFRPTRQQYDAAGARLAPSADRPRPAVARRQEVMMRLREGFHSRDAQADQRMWKNLGYGGKTSSEDTWRYWPQSGAGPWTIAAPLGAAVYTQDNLRLYYEGELIYEAKDGEGQWDVTWQALAHFYGVLARRVAKGIPLSEGPSGA